MRVNTGWMDSVLQGPILLDLKHKKTDAHLRGWVRAGFEERYLRAVTKGEYWATEAL